MNDQTQLAIAHPLDALLPVAFTLGGKKVSQADWDRFQRHLAHHMKRRTFAERADRNPHSGTIDMRVALSGMTKEERVYRIEARKAAVLEILRQAPAPASQIRDALAGKHPVTSETLLPFLRDMERQGLIVSAYNRIEGSRALQWRVK